MRVYPVTLKIAQRANAKALAIERLYTERDSKGLNLAKISSTICILAP